MLAFAVRTRVVAWLLGQLLLPLTGLAAAPAAFALFAGETGFALRCAAVAIIFISAGWPMARIEASPDVRSNEAMVAIALIFLIAAAGMTWPIAGDGLDALDAWFESVSAITTTGLTTLENVAVHSPAFQFTRVWMQWYGGLAIIVLAVALVLAPGVAARRLAGTDSDVPDIVSGTRSRTRQALIVYVCLTTTAVAFLILAGANPFDALVHGLAAVSTGGFSNKNGSLGGFGGSVQVVAGIASFCGAMSLTLYVRGWQGRWRSVVRDPNMHAMIWATLTTAVLVLLFMILVGGRPWAEALHHAALLGVSAQTTTGFSSLDVGTLDPASKLTLVGAMFVGGDSGSTAGGIKVGRLLVMLALVRLVFARTRLSPHAVAEPALSGRRLEGPEVQLALAIVILFAIVIGISWLAFVASGHDALNSLFEVTSATCTVGLSTGITSAELAPGLKWLLTVDMLMGRLEVVALIVLLYPPTWFGKRAEVS